MSLNIPFALTVAGSETTGGAGMQADLKTFEEYGLHGMVVLTSIVTMNPDDKWKHEMFPVNIATIRKQFDTVLSCEKLHTIKTGMLPSIEIIELVKSQILKHNFSNIVIDPVMVCKNDSSKLNLESADALRKALVPLATVTTPNLFEAGILSGLGTLENVDDVKKAAKIIYEMGAKNVVIKGGSRLDEKDALDVFYDGKDYEILKTPKMENSYNQGAGCSFSAAIAAGLAKGFSVKHSVIKAKEYVTSAIKHGFPFNKYTGSIYHAAKRAGDFNTKESKNEL